MKTILFVALAFAGCAVVVKPIPLPTSSPPCASSTPLPRQTDVCPERFTADGLACVRCAVPSSCILGSVIVYCTSSCADPVCSHVAGQ